MILDSAEDFAEIIKNNWADRSVSVSKTVPAQDIRIKIQNARILAWKEMNRTIREKHSPDTVFLVITGTAIASGANKENKTRMLIIAIEGDTVYDVRDTRLVVLTPKEVVELRPADGHQITEEVH